MHGGNRSEQRTRSGLLPFLVALAVALTMFPNVEPASASTQQVIVRAEHAMVDQVRGRVEALGGEVVRELSIIDGFAARVPSTVDLASLPGVIEVAPDGRIQLASRPPVDGYTSMNTLTNKVLDADRLWARGITGEGVGVALIDTGVTPVQGLNEAGRIVNGPDLSFDSGAPELRHLDLYGHGTHLAGIIAGHDEGFDVRRPDETTYAGIAPEAQIVNVKVADAAGTADVSQVIAGIQWVIDHRDEGPVDIRVLALAFGTDSTQDYRSDPLSYAVEQAWHSGIVVVVAGGNDSADSPLRNPATNPYVIAVGALDTNNTAKFSDDRTLEFSNCGDGVRQIDVLAPGKSIASLRVGGSYIDHAFPEAEVGDRYFRGTGSSQATAVVAGSVALLLDQRPELTPDQVKELLTATTRRVRNADGACADAGSLDLRRAARSRAPGAEQTWDRGNGSGSLDDARGSYRLSHDGVELTGDVDVTGRPFDDPRWTGGEWDGVTWSGGSWNDGSWNGVTWSGVTWSGVTWSSVTWSGVTWSGVTWSGVTWSGDAWNGVTWSGVTWSGVTWSGVTWSGSTWSGAVWR